VCCLLVLNIVIFQCLCGLGQNSPDGGPCAACAYPLVKTIVGNSSCVACPLGKERKGASNVGGPCTDCGVGQYSKPTWDEWCVGCELHRYYPTVATTVPLVCPPDTIVNRPGLRSSTTCYCLAGSTGPNVGPCTSCADWKYTSTVGSSNCINCEAGKYSPNAVGATYCINCPTDMYSVTVGANSSSTCNLLTESHDIVPFHRACAFTMEILSRILPGLEIGPFSIGSSVLFSKARSSSFLAGDFSRIFADLPAYPGRYTNSAFSIHCHVTPPLPRRCRHSTYASVHVVVKEQKVVRIVIVAASPPPPPSSSFSSCGSLSEAPTGQGLDTVRT
jgi:hypothetical protein